MAHHHRPPMQHQPQPSSKTWSLGSGASGDAAAAQGAWEHSHKLRHHVIFSRGSNG
uniref:Uncharacterized protein n=1 Tax=Physcomitrium patens TaxID=3218 RepID=A0A2K1JY56_PHYPA|nr:hypothetical protein PHYPA_013580 [Physcomitrium patens]